MIITQIRPRNTSANVLYRGLNESEIIDSLYICNLTNQTIRYSVYMDKSGSRFSRGTAIIYNYELDANDTDLLPLTLYGASFCRSEAIAVRTDTARSTTFTLMGRNRKNSPT